MMESGYHAFLLRIWKREDFIGEKWFMSLEDPTSHQKFNFQTFDDLFCFIRKIPDQAEIQPGDQTGSRISN